MRERSYISIKFLRLTLGAFFIILGITGIFPDFSEKFFSLSSGYNSWEVIFGITELVCGILLLLGFVLFSNSRAIYWGGLIVLIFWIIRIVLTKFVWQLEYLLDHFSAKIFVSWLLELTSQLVIASGLLVIIRRYD